MSQHRKDSDVENASEKVATGEIENTVEAERNAHLTRTILWKIDTR